MKEIPHIELPEMYNEHEFIDSPLVKIPDNSGIKVELQYPLMGMENAINDCFVRKEVLEKLLEAKMYLPEGITFKIWDAYRPFALQEELYYKYREKIIDEFKLKDLSLEEQNKVINYYVALPIRDEELPPQHTTGGAIDLTLVDIKSGKDLDLGIPFDSFSNLTNTDSFENVGMDETIKNNRRILYNAMTKAGFTNLPSECWHYDYGNKNWAYYNKKPAIYKGIFDLNNDNIK